MPLIYSGVILGWQVPHSFSLLFLVLLAAVGARTVSFALNRIIDREIDKRNPRTALRELPSGMMSINEALAVLIAGCICYFGTAMVISTFCLVLSPIPIIIFVIYPYMKRFTAFAHFGVGLGMSMAPLGGYFAASSSFSNIFPAVLLCLFTLFWGAGFDIIYATLDEEFDRQEHLFSFVSKFGRTRALVWSSIFHAIAFVNLVALFFITIRTWYAAIFLLASGIMLWMEQRTTSNVKLSFFQINAALGFVVFAMILLQ